MFAPRIAQGISVCRGTFSFDIAVQHFADSVFLVLAYEGRTGTTVRITPEPDAVMFAQQCGAAPAAPECDPDGLRRATDAVAADSTGPPPVAEAEGLRGYYDSVASSLVEVEVLMGLRDSALVSVLSQQIGAALLRAGSFRPVLFNVGVPADDAVAVPDRTLFIADVVRAVASMAATNTCVDQVA